jgi:hypothetical protein
MTLYYKLENGNKGYPADVVMRIEQSPDLPRNATPISLGWVPYEETPKPVAAWNQRVEELVPVNGQQVWSVVDLPTDKAGAILIAAIQAKQAQIELLRQTKTDGGYPFKDKVIQSRADDRENLQGAAVMALAAMSANPQAASSLRWADPNNDFGWITADNSVLPLTAMDVVQMFETGAALKTQYIFTARALKDAVGALTDATAVAAFDVTVGWPAASPPPA